MFFSEDLLTVYYLHQPKVKNHLTASTQHKTVYKTVALQKKLDLAFNNVKPKDWYFFLNRFNSGQDWNV